MVLLIKRRQMERGGGVGGLQGMLEREDAAPAGQIRSTIRESKKGDGG